MSAPYRLRVLFEDGAIQRMVLPERPHSVIHLKSLVMQHFSIDGQIELQFQDPQSDIMCSLTCTDNLPNKGTIKILMVQETISNSQPLEDTQRVTAPHHSGSSSQHFCLPTFSNAMDLILRKGNEEYFRHGKQLILIREQREDILDVVARALYAIKVCPNESDFEEATEALIKQFPCIADRSTPKGWGGWKIGLKFKLGKYRHTAERGGCTEVAEKSCKDGAGLEPFLKHPRMVAVSSAQFPQGEGEQDLDELRVRMALEMKKLHKDLVAINRCMGKTFTLRRQEIVNSSPAVTAVESRWPALFLQTQICAEFQRITNQNLLRSFYKVLDKHSERLLNLSREKQLGKFGHRLSAILKAYDANVKESDFSLKRTTVIHCLPALLGEGDSEVFKVCKEAEQTTLENSNSPICILSIVPNDEVGNAVFLQPCQVNIILEGRVVTAPLHSWSDAFIYLFGLIYALHLNYPKSLLNTFLFIQQVLLQIDGDKLKPKILALSKKL